MEPRDGEASILTKNPYLTPYAPQAALLQTIVFGGYLVRKVDEKPGLKTLWLGLNRVRDFYSKVNFSGRA